MSKIIPTAEIKESVSFLVVDDDAMVRTILIEYLMSFGFKRIEEAKNGRHAMKMIQYENKFFDVVISDWEMPEVDGLVLLKSVRNNSLMANTKFIMVTSQSSQERFKITRAAKSRVDAYMVKPFRGDTLKSKLYEVLGWEEENKKAS
jgi:two-component system chemotaxis response regulator CheY